MVTVYEAKDFPPRNEDDEKRMMKIRNQKPHFVFYHNIRWALDNLSCYAIC